MQPKALEKFIALVKKEQKRVSNKLKIIVSEFENKNKYTLFSKENDSYEDYFERVYLGLKEELNQSQLDLFEYNNILEWLLTRIQENRPFNDFAILQKFMDKFRLSKDEQASILAVLFANNIKAFGLIDDVVFRLKDYVVATNYEDYKNTIIKLLRANGIEIDPNDEALSKPLFNYVIGEIKNDNIKNMFQAYQKLVELIDVNGNIIGLPNAFEYAELFLDCRLELSLDQINLIIKTSTTKYQAAKAELKTPKIENEISKVMLNTPETIIKNDKNRRNAIQELKKYFVNDKPIGFINENEVDNIVSLLKEAGYTNEKINKIIKSIFENNALQNAQALEKALHQSELENLSDVQRETLKTTRMVLDDENAIENELLAKVKTSYELIASELVKLSDLVEDREYTKEYLDLLIEELRDFLIEYSYSDYRLVLARTKEGEKNE